MTQSRGGARSGHGQGHREDEVARIRKRFARLGPQQRALILAIRPFTDDHGRFDRRVWDEAFASADPKTIHEVVGATGTFERLVNHLNGMLVSGARLARLSVVAAQNEPSTPAIVRAIRDDGGLTARQAEFLIRLNRTRNRLQHASLDVLAEEVHADIELLLHELKGLVRSYVDWLGGNGFELLRGAEGDVGSR